MFHFAQGSSNVDNPEH